MDIFDMFFGGGMRGHRGHEGPRRGRDMVHPLKVISSGSLSKSLISTALSVLVETVLTDSF